MSAAQPSQRVDESDEPSLKELARLQIKAHPYFSAQARCDALDIEQCGSTLRLSGSLPSFYLKQLVQEAVRGVPGVGTVENNIEIDSTTFQYAC